MLAKCVAKWSEAVAVMHGQFNHTGFDFGAMQPIDNGRWSEGDAAAGVALTGVWGAQDAAARGDPDAAGTDTARLGAHSVLQGCMRERALCSELKWPGATRR